MRVEYRELFLEREGDPYSLVECPPVIYEVIGHEPNPERYRNPWIGGGPGDYTVHDGEKPLSIPVCQCRIIDEGQNS